MHSISILRLIFFLQPNLGDFEVLGKTKLSSEAFDVWHAVCLLQQLTQLPGARLQLFFLVARGSHQLIRPNHIWALNFIDEKDSWRGQQTGLKLEKFCIHKCQLERILSQAKLLGLIVHNFAERGEEVVRSAEDQIEIEHFQYLRLHPQQVGLSEGTRRQTHQLVCLRNLICLLVFCSYQQCRRADQLQLLPFYCLQRKVFVDDGCHDEQGLREHLELEMNVDDPVEQNTPHFLSHFALPCHASDDRHRRCLLSEHEVDRLVEVISKALLQLLLHLAGEPWFLNSLRDVRLYALARPQGDGFELISAKTETANASFARPGHKGLVFEVSDLAAK